MATGRIKIEVDTEEADKWLSSVLWHKAAGELPTPFVSVLAYVPDEARCLPCMRAMLTMTVGGTWYIASIRQLLM